MFQNNKRHPRMKATPLKLASGVTALTSSLYLLFYLTLPRQESCKGSPGPGDRTLNTYKERTVREDSQTVTTETLPQIFQTRNLSVLVRPERRTVLVEGIPRHCQGNTTITLLIAVFSAPGNSVAREIVR